MKLIWATDDFKMGGLAYSDFPIILHDTGESAVEVNEFLRHYLLRGAIRSKQSWPSTARALYDYFGFLQANDLHWKDVDRGEHKTLVTAYRDYSFTQVGLARSTVSQRLLYICEFYEYALTQKWISRLPYTWEERRVHRTSKGFMAHIDASGSTVAVRDVMPRKEKHLPKFLTIDEVRALLAAAKNPHHHLMIRFALYTGLRRGEIASFPTKYVGNPEDLHGNGRNVTVKLDPSDGSGMRTKGQKRRDILIPRHIMKDLYRYIIQTRGELTSRSSSKHNTLFLNNLGQPYGSHGKQISVIVREIGLKANIKVHPHILRHTYATHMLAVLQRNRAGQMVEPLVLVQRQLGHVSIETTMIYAHLIDSLVDKAVLSYDEELSTMLEIL